MLKCFWRCSAMALVLELFFSGSRHPAEYTWTTPAASSVPPNVNLAAALTWTITTWAIQLRYRLSKETNYLWQTNLTRHCLIKTFPNKPEMSIIFSTLPNPQAGDMITSILIYDKFLQINIFKQLRCIFKLINASYWHSNSALFSIRTSSINMWCWNYLTNCSKYSNYFTLSFTPCTAGNQLKRSLLCAVLECGKYFSILHLPLAVQNCFAIHL